MTDTPPPEPETPETDTDALGKVKGFVEEHPVAMVAGGILLGALVAGAFARPRAKAAKVASAGSIARTSLPRRAMEIAAVGIELAAAYAAGAAGEKAAAEPEETAKAAAPRLPGLAGKALRTLGPIIKSRLPGKKDA